MEQGTMKNLNPGIGRIFEEYVKICEIIPAHLLSRSDKEKEEYFEEV